MLEHTTIKTRAAALGAVALIGTVGAIALTNGASAQTTPTTRTIVLKELEKGSTFKHVRVSRNASPRSNLQGDTLVFTYPLADPAGKVVGRMHVHCTTTVGARNFEKSQAACNAVYQLSDGTLAAQALLDLDSPTVTAAITGGTGAYANARGVLVSKEVRGGSDDTITLTS